MKTFKSLLIFVFSFHLKLLLLERKKYASIGGQAVIEGVMMRSPQSFVVAIRLPSSQIQLRKEKWFSISHTIPFFKKPFFRGILAVIESMANGITALNYSANVAMKEELKLQNSSKDEQKNISSKLLSEKIGITTFLTMLFSFALGIMLFIFLPHWITIVLGFSKVETFSFHLIDGILKSFIFIIYILLISLIPDIKRIFQYHGAEHMAIATFEAEENLTVENAKKYSTLHPRCGTSFIFFLIFLSILLFSTIFALLPVAKDLPFWSRHLVIAFSKIFLMFPVAGLAFELIKLSGNYPKNYICRLISYPGLLLQKITTKVPDSLQLEVALASIKTVLLIEEHHASLNSIDKLKENSVIEISINSINEIETSNLKFNDFIE